PQSFDSTNFALPSGRTKRTAVLPILSRMAPPSAPPAREPPSGVAKLAARLFRADPCCILPPQSVDSVGATLALGRDSVGQSSPGACHPARALALPDVGVSDRGCRDRSRSGTVPGFGLGSADGALRRPRERSQAPGAAGGRAWAHRVRGRRSP